MNSYFNDLQRLSESELLPKKEQRHLQKILNQLLEEVEKITKKYRVAESPLLEWNEHNLFQVPYVCGVYLLYDATGDLIYVGSAGAARLGERLQQHWREPKFLGIAYFSWIQISSMDNARDLEAYLIKTFQPFFNRNLR